MPSRDARLLRAALGRDGPVRVDLDDPAWWSAASSGRVVPLLAAAALADGASVGSDAFARVDRANIELATAAVLMEQAFLPLASALDGAQVVFAVTKGLATAHLDHADPSWRQFGDIDLLVAPASLDSALALLADLGWRVTYALPQGHRRYTHAVTLSNGGVLELDLHQRIGHRALGMLVPTDELLAEREPFTIAGQTLWALAETDRLIHAAIHMVSSRGTYRRLSSVADVLLLSYLQEDAARAVVDRADGWRVGTLVRRAVTDAWAAAQLPVPDGWVDAIAAVPSRRARLVDAAYLADRRRPIVEEIAHLQHLTGTRDRLAYLNGLVRPGADYRAVKGRTTVRAQLHYLWSRIRSR